MTILHKLTTYIISTVIYEFEIVFVHSYLKKTFLAVAGGIQV